MSYDTVRRVVLCRTVSYSVVLCRTVSYCVVLCRTMSYCVVLCRTVSYCVVLCRTVSYCVVLCRTVSYSVYIHTYIYIYMSYDTVRRVVLCRTVSYSVVLCRTVSYCVVLCRTMSYCVVLCRTVSYCVVLCRTVSYCVVLCRTVSYCVVQCIHTYIYIHIYVVRHCTTRRTVSYCVVLCRTVSYCVVLCRTVSYCVVLCRTVSYQRRTTLYDASYSVVQCRTVSYSVVQCRTASYSVVRHCTTRRTVSYKVSGPDASGMYDASYSVVQGVGARRVGDVRRVGRCRGPTRRKIPTSTVVANPAARPATRNLGNYHGTGEDVHFVTRTFEGGVAIATLLSVLSIVPRHCARLTCFLPPKLREIHAVPTNPQVITLPLRRLWRAGSNPNGAKNEVLLAHGEAHASDGCIQGAQQDARVPSRNCQPP